MPYLDINGHKLFYEIQGQGSNSLIFIHGLCGDHRVWSKNIPALTDHYRVVSIDLFGHGDSSKEITPKDAFESISTAIGNLIEKENLQKVVLIGHSITGNILSSCIEQNVQNVRGYVFVDCTFNATEKVVNSRNDLADSLLDHPTDQLNAAITDLYKTMMDMSANPADNELILSALKKVDGNWALNFLKHSNFVRKPPHTKLPILIFESIWLTKDEPERSFTNVFPNSTFSHWPVSNHFFFVYEPQKFNRILQGFLKKT